MTIHAEPTVTDRTASVTALALDIGTSLRADVGEHDRRGEINAEAFARLRAAGLTAALVPAEFGGGGATHAEMGEVLRTLGRSDPATALTLSMHSHLVAAQVWRHKHEMDAEKVFRAVTDGAILISTGASDWVGSNGHAERVDGGYRVTARKGPASGCEVGQILVTSFRWDDAPDGPQVLHCSLPMSAEGVSIDRTWDTLGMRATGSHTVVLDDVFVPDGAVSLTRPAQGWPPFFNVVVGAALPLILAAYLGVADAAVELASAGVRGRGEAHTTLAVGEMVRAHTMAADTVSAMFLAADDLRFPNTDELAGRNLARKSIASDALIGTVRQAVEVVGGSGYSRSSALERLLRDVLGCQFHPLPRARQTLFTGRAALGLDPMG